MSVVRVFGPRERLCLEVCLARLFDLLCCRFSLKQAASFTFLLFDPFLRAVTIQKVDLGAGLIGERGLGDLDHKIST